MHPRQKLHHLHLAFDHLHAALDHVVAAGHTPLDRVAMAVGDAIDAIEVEADTSAPEASAPGRGQRRP